jgi:hypothetical protein
MGGQRESRAGTRKLASDAVIRRLAAALSALSRNGSYLGSQEGNKVENALTLLELKTALYENSI